MAEKPFYDCITEFIFLEDQPQKADILFVPGGNYPDSALLAAKLYLEGYAPYVLPSGRYSILKGHFEPDRTQSLRWKKPQDIAREKEEGNERGSDIDWQKECSYETEWDYLKDVLMRSGVPEAAILREDQATYTYENAIRSRQVTEELGISVRRAILCCQAFHARRSLMYYQEQFPETEFLVCPVVTKGISRENWFQTELGIETVLGEMERCGSQFHEIMKAYRSK